MYKKTIISFIVLTILAACAPHVHDAEPQGLLPASSPIVLNGGESVQVKCNSPLARETKTVGGSETLYDIECVQLTATPTRTATSIPPTATVPSTAINNTMQGCHTPGAHDGLNPHEHGDCAPAWANAFSIANFGHPVIFGGDERSSDVENVMKHQAFKGVVFNANRGDTNTANDVIIFLRYHAASNPMDRVSPFHSYERYILDRTGIDALAAGNMAEAIKHVTFRQGVFWVGYPEFDSQRSSRYNELKGTVMPDGSLAPGRDQFVLASPDSRDWFKLPPVTLQTRCEQWYTFAGQYGGEFSITICSATTLFQQDEHLLPYHDMTTWLVTGGDGLGRRIEDSLYNINSPVSYRQPAGWFCMSHKPIEDRVEGFTHRPKWTIKTLGITKPSDCPAGFLPQFTSPTFPLSGVHAGLGNTLNLKTFPGRGIVTIPN